jgi:hypothetical protein
LCALIVGCTDWGIQYVGESSDLHSELLLETLNGGDALGDTGENLIIIKP